MDADYIENLNISSRLRRTLKKLETITKSQENMLETPAHGGEDGKMIGISPQLKLH